MSYPLFKEYNTSQASFQDEALKGNTTGNHLSDVYFSKENVEALQDGIRFQVYAKSGNRHVIDRQSDTDLKIIMRSVYTEYSRNLDFDILGQIRELNSKVLDYCVNRILEEIKMYLYYRSDISQSYKPMPRSENTSSAGSKTLYLKDF